MISLLAYWLAWLGLFFGWLFGAIPDHRTGGGFLALATVGAGVYALLTYAEDDWMMARTKRRSAPSGDAS